MGSAELLSEIVEYSRSNERVLIASAFDGSGKLDKLVLPLDANAQSQCVESPTFKQLLDLAHEMTERRRPTIIAEITWTDGSLRKAALELIRPKPSIIVYGAGHVGRAVAMLGAMLGYDVTVFDDREFFARRDKLPDERIKIVVAPFEQALEHVNISGSTAIVIVTRGHQYDEVCLRLAAPSPAAYIGMIGSRRRVIGVFDRLTGSGIDRTLLERVHAPIGLSISARSPQEIGVAIIAQIIQTLNGG